MALSFTTMGAGATDVSTVERFGWLLAETVDT